jgi:DNA-binding NarL/FixJ family response regulator
MLAKPIAVLCVDDNQQVVDGLCMRLALENDLRWLGALAAADHLVAEAQRLSPNVVLLDIDMPGKDALVALRELSEVLPDIRTIILSGHERDDYLDRAVEAGAWGYLSKNDHIDQIIHGIRRVASGQFAFSQTMLRGVQRS